MKDKIFFSREDLLKRKNKIIEIIKEEGSKYVSLSDIFQSNHRLILGEDTIKIRNSRVLIRNIYNNSIRYVCFDGKEYPFVSELGLKQDNNELKVDTSSLESLDKIIKAAEPYYSIIRARDTCDPKYRKFPLFDKFDNLGTDSFNKPKDFIPFIKYQNGTFMFQSKPGDLETLDHTHVFNCEEPIKERVNYLVPSFGDYADYSYPRREKYQFTILYVPIEFSKLHKKEIPDYANAIDEDSVIGLRTVINLKRKKINMNWITG